MEVSRLPADGAAAVAFDEVDNPIVVVLKAHQDLGIDQRSFLRAANASLHSAVLGVVGTLGCEHVTGKSKENFDGTVSPMPTKCNSANGLNAFRR